MGATGQPTWTEQGSVGDHAVAINCKDGHNRSRMDALEEEALLVSKSRNGDHQAYASLIRIHQRMIHSLTYRMTGSLADADDLAQETFIRAFSALDSYQASRRFSTWLYRIAVNACLDFRRKESRRRELHASWCEVADAAPSPEARRTDRDELSDQVQEALLQLSSKQRLAIVLTIFEGLSHAEAARTMSCSEATLSWRVFAARRRLKRIRTRWERIR